MTSASSPKYWPREHIAISTSSSSCSFFVCFRKGKERELNTTYQKSFYLWREVNFTADPASFHGDSNLTRLHDVEAVGHIPLQTNSGANHWDVTVLKWAVVKRTECFEREKINHLSDDLLWIIVGPGRYDVDYLHPLRELQTGDDTLDSVTTVKSNHILCHRLKKQTNIRGKEITSNDVSNGSVSMKASYSLLFLALFLTMILLNVKRSWMTKKRQKRKKIHFLSHILFTLVTLCTFYSCPTVAWQLVCFQN